MTGPSPPRRPRTSSRSASSGEAGGERPGAGARSMLPSGRTVRTSRTRSAATHRAEVRSPCVPVSRPARRSRTRVASGSVRKPLSPLSPSFRPVSRRRAAPDPPAPCGGLARRRASRISPSVRKPSMTRASWSASAVSVSGHASARTRSTASGSSRPRSAALAGSSQRRPDTARVRRSSSGASSRNAYGFAFRTSWAKGEGSGRSRACTATSPRSMPSSRATRPPASIASCIASWMVWRTRGWSGISRAPARFSAHAIWSGKTTATRSSACIRWTGAGVLRPPARRGTASDTFAFQRQRTVKRGASRTACTSTSRAVALAR